MKYRFTILNISAFIFLIGILVTTIVKYKTLAVGEGWGIVAMVGLSGLGCFALAFDYILQLFIKKKGILNIIGVVIVIAMTFLIICG